MPATAPARVAEVGAPEPGLTPQEIIARARALIPQIRDQQDEAERLGHHTEALDREFVKAGVYRMLPPPRVRGCEVDQPQFLEANVSLSPREPAPRAGPSPR